MAKWTHYSLQLDRECTALPRFIPRISVRKSFRYRLFVSSFPDSMFKLHQLTKNSHSYVLMIGGTALAVFCLFMLSITHAGQYYQVSLLSFCICLNVDSPSSFKVFLSHGLGFGLATGITYVPGFAVMGHYFRKRRPLALGICASVSIRRSTKSRKS
jgi:hypothetical protein